jgi:hypothetical protein
MSEIVDHDSEFSRRTLLKALGGAAVLGLAGVEAARACVGFVPDRTPVTTVGPPPDPDRPREVAVRTTNLETFATPPNTLCAACLVTLADVPINDVIRLAIVLSGSGTPAPGFPATFNRDPRVDASVKRLLTGIFTPAPVKVFGFSARTIGTVPPSVVVDLATIARLKRGRTGSQLQASLDDYHAWVTARFVLAAEGDGAGPRGGGNNTAHQVSYRQIPEP